MNNNEVFTQPNKWKDPCIAPNGKVYSVPFDALYILQICPFQKTMTLLNLCNEIKQKCNSGFWGTICTSEGILYGVPYMSNRIMRYDLNNHNNGLIGPDLQTFTELNNPRHYIGGVIDRSGKIIVFIPYDANHVMLLDTESENVSFIGETYRNISGKWAGGVLANDGHIYCFPASSNKVLKINTVNKTTSEINIPVDVNDVTRDKWIGGVTRDKEKIYSAPFNHNSILCIDSVNQDVTLIDIPAISNYEIKRLWIGGSVSLNNDIYFFPYDAPGVLKFLPGDATTFLIDDMQMDLQHKFSGSVTTRSGKIIPAPCNSSQLAILDCSDGNENFEFFSNENALLIAMLKNNVQTHKKKVQDLKTTIRSLEKQSNQYKRERDQSVNRLAEFSNLMMSPDELEQLGVDELKQVEDNLHDIMKHNIELINKTKDTLRTKQSGDNRESSDEKLCIICNGVPKSVLFMPCKHIVACSMCSNRLHQCPVCRENIQNTIDGIHL